MYIDNEICDPWGPSSPAPTNILDEDYHFYCCTDDPAGPIGITNGDSGGPAIVQDTSGTYFLAGINSWAWQDSIWPDIPTTMISVFSRLDDKLDWIYESMEPDTVVIANYNNSPSNLLTGTLQIDNFKYSISSGDTILAAGVSVSAPAWTIRTLDEVISDTLKHYRWNSSNNEYLMYHNNQFDGFDFDYAKFEVISEIFISSNLPTFPSVLYLHDPWYLDSQGIQPDELLDFSTMSNDSSYNVFLNQNPLFQPTIPIYQLCAKGNYADVGAIFEFDHWTGNDIDFGTNDTNEECITLVFEEAGATAQAIYDTISYNSVLTLDEDLTIPAGAEYSFGGSFRIDVEEGATLTFDGAVDTPINLLPLSSANGWDGIRVKDSSDVQLNYTKIIGADICLDIQSDNPNISDIVNNTFAYCDTAIKINEAEFDDLDITNNIFYQNDVGIESASWRIINPSPDGQV